MHGIQSRQIKEWMTAEPITIPSDSSLPEAYWLMVENNIRRLLVVDDEHLVGVITMDDLRGFFHNEIIAINPLKVNELFSQMPVKQLMSKNPITIPQDGKVVDAARQMLAHKISTLPVIESGKVVGIITESDLFHVLVDICLDQNTEKDRNNEAEFA
jgi:acetoin utilization protein AcuB